MRVDYPALIQDQLRFYWDVYFRPRLDGLTDDEYLWEPVEGMWTLRPQADGLFQVEQIIPEPSPSPVTTIGWRLMHVASNLYFRSSAFFSGEDVPSDVTMFDPRFQPPGVPGTANEGIAFLDEVFDRWMTNLAGLDAEGWAKPLGALGGAYFASEPMAALAIHINREVMHHGGEVLLLRDLYHTRHSPGKTD